MLCRNGSSPSRGDSSREGENNVPCDYQDCDFYDETALDNCTNDDVVTCEECAIWQAYHDESSDEAKKEP